MYISDDDATGCQCSRGETAAEKERSIDAARPQAWHEDALALPASRAAYRRIENLGFTDAFRALNQAGEHYSFWDFQSAAWQRNDGIRIDHFLLSPQCADLLTDCQIDAHIRGYERPSDHVPVWVELDA